MAKEIDLGFDMAIEVHAHKSGKLHKSGVDAPQSISIALGHDTDQVTLKPFDRLIVDIDAIDAKSWPAVAQPRAGYQLAKARDCPLKRIAR